MTTTTSDKITGLSTVEKGRIGTILHLGDGRVPATFASADHPDTYTCRCCAQVLPTRSFPTTASPAVRSTRCRRCRDAARARA